LRLSLSRARQQATWPTESEIINCRCWSCNNWAIAAFGSWCLAYFIASAI